MERPPIKQENVQPSIQESNLDLKIPALRAKPKKDVKPNGSPDAAFIIERVVDAWDDL